MAPGISPTSSDNEQRATSSDRAYSVLQSLRSLGPGAHPLHRIISAARLSRSTVQRRLTEMIRADLCRELPGTRGYYELTLESTGSLADTLEGLVPLLPQVERELTDLQKHLGHPVVLHGKLPGTPLSRLCVAYREGQSRALTHALNANFKARARLRLAPLDADAPGWVIAAAEAEPPTRPDLPSSPPAFARSSAPLPDWDLLSMAVIRGDRVVGAVSVMAPSESMQAGQCIYRTALDGCRKRLAQHLLSTAVPSPF